MMPMALGRRLASLALPLLATACSSSPEPVYYTVVTRPGPTLLSAPKIVLVKDIGLASYLDRREIVRSSEGYKLDIMANDWWGEPIGSMLARVLVLDLSQRLPKSSVYGESGAISVDPYVTVAVNIQRLDGNRAGMLILNAQVACDFNRPRRSAARNFSIARPIATRDMAGFVAAVSDAMGELADGIAALLQP
jgi:uncharacterized lipoprotein YmbA